MVEFLRDNIYIRHYVFFNSTGKMNKDIQADSLEKFQIIKRIVFEKSYPSKHAEFGGAGLIVTDDPDRNHYETDILVFHPEAQSLSWLVFQLKELFEHEINSINKYYFYGTLGEMMNDCIRSGCSLHETMIYILGRAVGLGKELV